MALKYFLIFAGAFLASSLLIMAFIKPLSSSFGNYGKKPWIFNIASSAIVSGIAFATTYITKNLFFTFWILSAVFLLFGMFIVLMVHKKYFKIRHDNWTKQFFAEFLFCISIILLSVAIFSSLQYFIKAKDFMHFPMLLCMLFLLIPFLLLHVFDAAISIPQPLYNYWKYPLDNTIELPDEDEKERLYVIGLEIPKTETDKESTYFTVKAPENMKLGDLFYHFINDYNDVQVETPIKYANGESIDEWTFRTKPKWNTFSKF
ncbi:TssN family type VI secretion system protein [Niabella ginsengisoli]|uniref:TssN family type VI secretion system protein n=1 Tax=Niabella ginsengisoli TaxID=522298 RepID=A0ABS9SGQ5_9BACT|nr:TssN family type VI secretion system protein [Niabella ginsengisoli]MCH5597549.1 TssN family type VI secretion system protein [Niabella ginsengisoli]